MEDEIMDVQVSENTNNDLNETSEGFGAGALFAVGAVASAITFVACKGKELIEKGKAKKAAKEAEKQAYEEWKKEHSYTYPENKEEPEKK